MATATNVYSVGRDCTVIIQHPYAPNGGRLDLQHVTGFNAEEEYTTTSVKRLDGTRLDDHLPNGWHGSFDVDRGNQQLDQLQQAIDDAYYNLGTRIRGTVTQYVQEQDGSVTTFVFSNVVFKFMSGAWKDDQVVKQQVMFNASRRRKV